MDTLPLAHPLHPPLKRRIIPLYHPPLTKEPTNPRTRAKRAKHQRHTPIFIDMRDSFAAGACRVEVSALIGIEDGESGAGEAFWGDVDVGGAGVEGGRGGEEEGLGEGPFA